MTITVADVRTAIATLLKGLGLPAVETLTADGTR
jgi:hypothetical protein